MLDPLVKLDIAAIIPTGVIVLILHLRVWLSAFRVDPTVNSKKKLGVFADQGYGYYLHLTEFFCAELQSTNKSYGN